MGIFTIQKLCTFLKWLEMWHIQYELLETVCNNLETPVYTWIYFRNGSQKSVQATWILLVVIILKPVPVMWSSTLIKLVSYLSVYTYIICIVENNNMSLMAQNCQNFSRSWIHDNGWFNPLMTRGISKHIGARSSLKCSGL